MLIRAAVSFAGGLWFLFLFLFSKFILYGVLSACVPAGQKRPPDLITDGCEPNFGCWELHSGPLKEQAVLLTAEPFLQPIFLPYEGDSLSV